MAEVLRTRTAEVGRDASGVVWARIAPAVVQTPADAQENLAACTRMCDGVRRPLVVDIRGARPLDADTRHFYTGRVLVDSFACLVLLVDASPLGMMMGNVYFRVARPGIPTRLFNDESSARAWVAGLAP